MGLFNKAFKNISILVISSIIIKIVAIIFSFTAARILGVKLFGQYNFIWAYLGIFEMLSDFGLANIILRDLGKNKTNATNYLGSVLSLRFVLGIITYLGALIFIYILSYPSDIKNIVYISSLLIFPNIIFNLLLVISTLYKKIKYFSLINIFSNLLVFIINIVLLILGYKIKDLFISTVIINFVFAGISLLLINKKIIYINANINFCKWKYFIKESLPFALLSLLGIIYFKIDILLLSKLATDTALGYYSSVYKFLESLLIISSSYSTIILPIFSALSMKSSSIFKDNIFKSVKIMGLIGIIFALIFSFGSNFFILIFLGKEYLPAQHSLVILMWAIPLIFIANVYYSALYSLKKQRKVIYITGLAVVINILLNLILIPKYSYLGSAISTTATEIINVIFCILIFYRLPINNKKYV